jgi:hypothetical protein
MSRLPTALAIFTGLWFGSTLCAESTTAPATTSMSLHVAVERLPDDRKSSHWESILAALGKLPTRVLDAEERTIAVPQITPWVQRVVARAYWPDWDAVKWGVVVDKGLGDVFVGDYRVGGTAIHVVDTSTVLLMEFRDPQLDLPDDKQAVNAWINRVHLYCQQADAIVQPPRLWVGVAPDAMYCVPRYLDFARPKEPVGWRRLIQFKLARGYFSFAVVKLIDGDSRTDIPFGIRTRLENYADVVAGWNKEELLAQLKKRVDSQEMRVVLKYWNIRELSPAGMLEARGEGYTGLLFRGFIQDLRRRTPAGNAERELSDKVVEMTNAGRVAARDFLEAVPALAKDADQAALRRSISGIKDAELRAKALEIIKP